MRRWLVTLLLGVLGAVALLFLVRTRDQSRFWRLELDQQTAMREARRVAKQHGVNADEWSGICRVAHVNVRRHFEQTRRGPVHPLFTPLEYDVILTHPDGQLSARVTLTAHGRPNGWQMLIPPGRKLTPFVMKPADLLPVYAGPFAQAFRTENEGVVQGPATVHSWVWPSPNPQEASARLETTFIQGALTSAKLTPQLPSEFVKFYGRLRDGQTSLALSASTILINGIFFLAFPLFFRAWMRKLFPESLLARAYLVFALPVVAGAWHWVQIAGRFNAREAFLPLGTSVLGSLMGFLMLPAAMVVFWGAGRSVATERDLAQWFSLEAIFQRRWVRPVGVALVGGFLCGFPLACLLYLPGFGPGPDIQAMVMTPKFAVSPSPWAAPFEYLLVADVFGLFLLLWPMRRFAKFRWLGWVLFAAIATVALGTFREGYDFWFGHNLAAGLLLMLASVAIYHVFDLLAVYVAHVTAAAAVLAVIMSIQPAGLRLDALSAMMVPLLLLAVGLAGLVTGAPVDVAGEVAKQRAEIREAGSERDRLRAEFGVARKAQLGMLPEVPESIGGSTLAASCHAAREVGGDLYDFFECSDGRYALCVADVSGKGVPAALYMSLTKGILSAASLESAPIPQVMATLNRHLLEFGKRKMFVTMSLGYYDAKSRTLDHARAGHNPPLLWRARTSTAEFLKPRGVGLGLAGAAAFGRALEVERVTLEPDDIVVFYSDGIVEAMNLHKDQFGEDRLLEAVRDSAGLSAAAVEEEISRRVRLFAGAAPVHDDQTLFVLRVG